jgi:DNA-binding FadR family transcriptional regulator
VSIEPSVRLPAYQLLADDLRAQITSGQLRPGQRLPTEPELCAQSGLSRSTVREALRLLSSQHLVVTTRGVNGGSFVAKPSPAQLAETLAGGVRLLLSTAEVSVADMMEVREMLEVPAVGLAARRRTEADLDRLRGTMFDPVHDDLATRLVAHRAFHAALAAATGNPLYELMISPLYAVANEAQLGERGTEPLWIGVDAEHREILRCVVAGDVLGAQQAAQVHQARLRTTWPASIPLARVHARAFDPDGPRVGVPAQR